MILLADLVRLAVSLGRKNPATFDAVLVRARAALSRRERRIKRPLTDADSVWAVEAATVELKLTRDKRKGKRPAKKKVKKRGKRRKLPKIVDTAERQIRQALERVNDATGGNGQISVFRSKTGRVSGKIVIPLEGEETQGQGTQDKILDIEDAIRLPKTSGLFMSLAMKASREDTGSESLDSKDGARTQYYRADNVGTGFQILRGIAEAIDRAVTEKRIVAGADTITVWLVREDRGANPNG